MDLAVILPLSALLCVQLLVSLLLLSPRALSKHVAALLQLTRTSTAVSSVLYTVAVAVTAMAVSSMVQLSGVSKSLNTPLTGDRAMALTVEELRALLSVVLGVSNLALLFLNRALAYEQQAADKAQLNLSVLQKQAQGLQTEYMRATTTKGGHGATPGDSSSEKAEISKLISDKQKLQEAVEAAQAEAKATATSEAAMRAQAKGLEREYDRLLSENDQLKRRMARFDEHFAAGDKKSA